MQTAVEVVFNNFIRNGVILVHLCRWVSCKKLLRSWIVGMWVSHLFTEIERDSEKLQPWTKII